VSGQTLISQGHEREMSVRIRTRWSLTTFTRSWLRCCACCRGMTARPAIQERPGERRRSRSLVAARMCITTSGLTRIRTKLPQTRATQRSTVSRGAARSHGSRRIGTAANDWGLFEGRHARGGMEDHCLPFSMPPGRGARLGYKPTCCAASRHPPESLRPARFKAIDGEGLLSRCGTSCVSFLAY
jgi:hypothetical protein